MDEQLRRCRILEGTAHQIAALPEIREIRDATYVPFPTDGAWGLFDGDRPIDGANHARAPMPPLSREDAPDANYLYIGPMADHYGHFITDTLSRLWPLLGAGPDRPRLLYHGPADLELWRALPFVTDVLATLGLSVDDMVAFERPMRLARVTVPEPSFLGAKAAHAVYADLCRHVGRSFWNPETVDTVERPIFLSKIKLRQGGLHKVDNEDALVEELARRGVEIVYPEDLSFAEQVDLLARHRRILGLAGSALHTSLFSAPARNIVALNWCDKLNANFVSIDALNRNRSFYYYPGVTQYVLNQGFFLRWIIPDPKAVAAELVDRIADLDGLDARDAAADAARLSAARSLRGRLAALRKAAWRVWTKRVARRPAR